MPDIPENYRVLLTWLLVPGLYWVLVVAGRRLKRHHGVKLGFLYQLFAIAVALYTPAAILQMEWRLLRHLGAAVILLSSPFLIALLDRYVWELYFRERHGLSVPKFLTDVVRVAIVVLAIFVVLDFVFDQTVKGLLIAPGIAAVIIGLAMQDLVGNIIAGISLQGSKSFVTGDWLFMDNRYAEVVETNWRSTRLRTVDEITIEVPNREIARQTIINLNQPTRRHAMRIVVLLEYSAPPTRAKEVLAEAAVNTKGILPEPKPRVFIKDFLESGVQYEIKFWMEDHAKFAEVSDSVRTNAWYGLRRHGMKIPFPTRTVQLERPARDKQQQFQSTARAILRQQPIFEGVSDEELDTLLPRGRVVHFGKGEKLIRQGDNGGSMFILVDGQAQVFVERNGAPREVAGLASGDCFGEMSLLTGEERSATVVAATDCEVVEITKEVLAKSLQENPSLAQQLSQLLARRQMETEGALANLAATDQAASTVKETKYAENFLEKLRKFFQL